MISLLQTRCIVDLLIEFINVGDSEGRLDVVVDLDSNLKNRLTKFVRFSSGTAGAIIVKLVGLGVLDEMPAETEIHKEVFSFDERKRELVIYALVPVDSERATRFEWRFNIDEKVLSEESSVLDREIAVVRKRDWGGGRVD